LELYSFVDIERLVKPMSRPRKPTAILELNGAFAKNPKRGRARASEPKPGGPLGDPPAHLSVGGKAAWVELQSFVPANVLTAADRWLVELCCQIMADLRENGRASRLNIKGVPGCDSAQLLQGLSKMGLSPSDRSKVSVLSDEKPVNSFAELDIEEGTWIGTPGKSDANHPN
jgi:hypothetical protein